MKWFRKAAGLIVVTSLMTACSGGADSAESDAGDAPVAPVPAPAPRFDYDYTVMAFCITQERVIGLEVKIMENLPPEEAVPLLIEARRIASSTIPDLKQEGREDMIPSVRRWANSFNQSIRLAKGGADGLDTLRPAIKALHAVERAQTCILDND